MTFMNNELYVLRERVKWRSRRGLLELDLFFTRFLQRHLEALNVQQLEDLLDLLTCEDIDLWAMVSGGRPDDIEGNQPRLEPRWQPIMALLKSSAPPIPHVSTEI